MTTLIIITKRRRRQGKELSSLVRDRDESWTLGMFFFVFFTRLCIQNWKLQNWKLQRGRTDTKPPRHIQGHYHDRITASTHQPQSRHRPQQQQQQSQQSMVGPPGLFFFLINSILHLFFGFSYDNFFDHLSTSTTTTHQHQQHFSQHPKPLNASKRRWQQQQQQLETQHVSSHWYLFLFLLLFTQIFFSGSFNALKRRWQQTAAIAAVARLELLECFFFIPLFYLHY